MQTPRTTTTTTATRAASPSSRNEAPALFGAAVVARNEGSSQLPWASLAVPGKKTASTFGGETVSTDGKKRSSARTGARAGSSTGNTYQRKTTTSSRSPSGEPFAPRPCGPRRRATAIRTNHTERPGRVEIAGLDQREHADRRPLSRDNRPETRVVLQADAARTRVQLPAPPLSVVPTATERTHPCGGAGPENRQQQHHNTIDMRASVRAARVVTDAAATGAAPGRLGCVLAAQGPSPRGLRERSSRAGAPSQPGNGEERCGFDSRPRYQRGVDEMGKSPADLSRRTVRAVRAASASPAGVGDPSALRRSRPVQRGLRDPSRPTWSSLARRCADLRRSLAATAPARSTSAQQEDRPGRLSLHHPSSTARPHASA